MRNSCDLLHELILVNPDKVITMETRTQDFLHEMRRNGGNARMAARSTGFSEHTHYTWVKSKPKYAAIVRTLKANVREGGKGKILEMPKAA